VVDLLHDGLQKPNYGRYTSAFGGLCKKKNQNKSRVLQYIFDHAEIAVPTVHCRDQCCAFEFYEIEIKRGVELDRSPGADIGFVTPRAEGAAASKAV